ncbi:MAG: DUF3810 domain-containing protein [Clostridia bacterium]|nr:DUF3810 domain-containing protein [Clostridia bacterium]
MKLFIKKHPFWTAFLFVFLLCALLLLLFGLSRPFADGYSTSVGAYFRLLLGGITSIFPFSLFEILCVTGVLYLLFCIGLLIYFIVCRIRKKACRSIVPFLLAIPVVLFSVFDLFSLSFAASYFRTAVADEMHLPMEEVDQEAVFYALETLCQVVNETSPHLEKNEKGESLSPKLSQVKENVTAACNRFGDRNPFYQNKGFDAKNFLSSKLMTYTHISGIYGFFTGEANINTNYPHFIVTASLAHESCHARGIGPENECNFLASIILLESNDHYLRYCGAAYILDDFLDICAEIDKDRAKEVTKDLDPVLARDFAAYAFFFKPYRDSAASKVANTANNAYLNAMGQEDGTLSYSRIIRLVSAYFQKDITA